MPGAQRRPQRVCVVRRVVRPACLCAVAWEWLPVVVPPGAQWDRAGHTGVLCKQGGRLGVVLYGGVDSEDDKSSLCGFMPLTA